MSVRTEAEEKELAERVARLERQASINAKDIDNTFWIVMGVALIAFVKMAAMSSRIDDVRDLKLSNRDYFGILANKQ